MAAKKKEEWIIALRRDCFDGSYLIIDTRQHGCEAIYQMDDESEREFVEYVVQRLAYHIANVDIDGYDALDIPDDLAKEMGEILKEDTSI